MASNASHVTRHRLRHDQPWRRKRDRRRTVPIGSFEGMLAVIPSLPRQSLARLVQQAIDRIDDLDGDPDLGPDGDELDGSMGEDDFHHQNGDWRGYAGCPVADPAEDGCASIWNNGVRYWGYEREPE